MMKNLYLDKKDELPDNAFYIFNNSVRECINIIPGKVYAQRWSPSGRSIVVLIREKGGPLYIQIAGY